jgi:hypothetical protein
METCIDDVESIEGLFFHAEDFVEQASLFALEGVKLLLPDRPNIDKRKSLACVCLSMPQIKLSSHFLSLTYR